MSRRTVNSAGFRARAWIGGVLLAAWAVPGLAQAQVQQVGAISTATGVDLATVTVTHTVPAGTDRYLLVGVSKVGGGTGGTINSVTWNNGSAVQNLNLLGTVSSGPRQASIFGIVAPNTGTNGTVTVTLSAANMRSVVGVVNLVGVNQTTPGEDFFSATGGTTAATVNVCPTAAGSCPMEAGDLAVAVLGTGGGAGTVTVDPVAPSTIAFDAASASNGASVSSVTWNHTIGQANVRKLVVGVMVEADNSATANDCTNLGNADVTNVTYNSVALTHVPGADTCVQSANGLMARVEMWYADQGDLPLDGTYAITATLAGTVNEVEVGAISLDNAAQGAPEVVAGSTLDGGGDTITTNVGAGTLNAWLVDAVISGNAGTFTAGAGQVERVDTSNSSATGAMSTKASIGAGANSASQTYNTGADRLAHSVLRIAPHCPAAGCSSNTLWSLATGATNNQAWGVAWGQGGSGETFMTANLGVAQAWVLGAVLIKQTSFVTQAVIDGVRAWGHAGGAVLEWETLSEHGTLGFHVQRYDPDKGRWVRLSERLLPGLLHARTGGIYRFHDRDAEVGETYRYRIVELESTGRRNRYGPYRVTVDRFSGHEESGAASDAPVTGFARVVRTKSPVHEKRVTRKKAARAKAKKRRAARRGPAAKVSVDETGLYRLEASRIARVLGIGEPRVRALIGSGGFTLSNAGRRVATLRGEDDGSLYFYGEAIASQYTKENVYVLRRGRGEAMGSVSGAGAVAHPDQWFIEHAHAEGNRFTLTHLFDDPDDDYWMWDFRIGGLGFPDCATVAPPAPCYVSEYPIATPDVETGAEAEAELVVRLHGASNPEGTGDHRVTIGLNGEALGEVVFDGLQPFAARFKVPMAELLANENRVTVDVAASSDPLALSVVYVNDVTLAYARRQLARDGALAVPVAKRPTVTVGGFASEDVLLLDVSAGQAPKVVKDTLVERDGDGYRVSTAAGDATRLLAVTRAGALPVVDMVADRPSRLRARRNAADWVLITTGDLVASGETLAAHRRGQGLRAMVVDIEDVYDEFNHGIRSAEAIWRFLHHAYHRWSVAPRYVVLGGEGSHDYKDYLGHGDSLIPTLLTPTPDGLFPSDNLYADVTGNDWVPEMATGRLPVIDAAELDAVVAKLIAYDRNTAIDGWGRRVIVSADASEESADFTGDSGTVERLVPIEYGVNRVHVDELGPIGARDRMLAELSAGSAYLNFYGHSGHLSIGNFAPGLLTAGDVAGLGNGVRLPVVTAFTCLSGQFGFPGQESVGEQLVVTEDGGAVAVWAPSGLSQHRMARILGNGFYSEAFDQNPDQRPINVGDTVSKAQRRFADAVEDRFLLDIYNLIGDPATQVK